MLWTIASNWREREIRPIWKDNLLPLLFYGNKMDSKEPGALPWRQCDFDRDDVGTVQGEKSHLMEASEMNKISKSTPVTFQWGGRAIPNDGIESADTSAIALQDTSRPATQRRSRDTDVGSLLETIDVQDYRPSSVDTDRT